MAFTQQFSDRSLLNCVFLFSLSTKMQNSSVELREQARHYIPASDMDIQAMLDAVGKSSLDALYDHIPAEVRFLDGIDLPEDPLLVPAPPDGGLVGLARRRLKGIKRAFVSRGKSAAIAADNSGAVEAPEVVAFLAAARQATGRFGDIEVSAIGKRAIGVYRRDVAPGAAGGPGQ